MTKWNVMIKNCKYGKGPSNRCMAQEKIFRLWRSGLAHNEGWKSRSPDRRWRFRRLKMEVKRFFCGRNYANFKFPLSRYIAVYLVIIPVEYRPPRDFHFGNTSIASFWCQNVPENKRIVFIQGRYSTPMYLTPYFYISQDSSVPYS